jgi:DNA-binding MarR family transcriptional regulator
VRGHEKYPEVAIGEVAEDLKLQHSTASLLVDRAVKKGLLRRVEDASDRRRALVSLTDRGNQVLDRIMSANQEHLHALEAHVPGPPVLPAEDASEAENADGVREERG